MTPKYLAFALPILLSFLGVSCNKDDQSPTKNNGIQLNSFTALMLAGDKYKIDVLSEGDYAIVNDDTSVATGWWINDGKGILIISEKVGHTSVRVIDRKDSSKSVEIKVYSVCFTGDFTEVSSAGANQCEVLVMAIDNTVEELIRSELRSDISRHFGTSYRFDSSTKKIIIDFTDSRFRNDICEGTYEWSKDSLILHYDGITEPYRFVSINDQTIGIGNDLSNHYKQLYPNAGIQVVRITRILNNPIKVGGLI